MTPAAQPPLDTDAFAVPGKVRRTVAMVDDAADNSAFWGGIYQSWFDRIAEDRRINALWSALHPDMENDDDA